MSGEEGETVYYARPHSSRAQVIEEKKILLRFCPSEHMELLGSSDMYHIIYCPLYAKYFVSSHLIF